MSSWKKASKTNQKTHRERHQPESRKHLGFLEKKKDYKVRANHYNETQETLKVLKKRALNKNPDEFYHHMINSKIENGEHRENIKEDKHTPAQIHLMQTQDIKYVIMKRTIETNKIKRLQAELHMISNDVEYKNNHTFFVDNNEEMKNFDVAKRLDTHPSLISRRYNRPKLTDLSKIEVPTVDEKNLETLNSQRKKSYTELRKRIEREKELAVVQQKMEMKRVLQQKRLLQPKKIKEGTKDSAPIYAFKYERKK